MTDLDEQKAAARTAAFARRKQAFLHDDGAAVQAACQRLLTLLEPYTGRSIAGYMPMRSELDPLPAMDVFSRTGPVGVPVIQGPGQPLRFRRWTPGCALIEGPFRAMVPVTGEPVTPEVLIVPLVAFDRSGGRLGYGGGFYDRTLQALRADRPTYAVGFAFAAQQAETLPLEPTDQPLDAIVTERETLVMARREA